MRRKAALATVLVLVLSAFSGCGKEVQIAEEKQPGVGKTQEIDYQAWKEAQRKSEEKAEEAETQAKEEESKPALQEADTEENKKEEQKKPGGIPYYEEIYAGLLEEYYDLIVTTVTSEEFYPNDLYGKMGIEEIVGWNDDLEDALKSVGYSMQDINGDDIPELLVGPVYEQDGIVHGDTIFGMYTCVNDVPFGVIDGWYRSSYSIAEDGSFIYSGSGSAVHTILGKCYLASNAEELSWEHYYFTEFTDEEDTEIGCYYNTIGEWEVKASELLEITLDDLWGIQEELFAQVSSIDMMTFYDYRVPDEELLVNNAAEIPVEAAWAEEVLLDDTICDRFEADTSEYAEDVAFMSWDGVTDFKVLSLEYQDIDENGNLIFAETELYAQDALISEYPLVVRLTAYGTIPTYGISYVDGNGKLRKFAVSVSGFDGSVELTDFWN